MKKYAFLFLFLLTLVSFSCGTALLFNNNEVTEAASTAYIVYNANGGKFSDGSTSYKKAYTSTSGPVITTFSNIENFSNGINRAGYTFSSWSGVDSIPNGGTIHGTGTAVLTPGATYTLTAIWKASNIVSFYGNGGTPALQEIGYTSRTYGSQTFYKLSSLPSTPSRTGYTFNGWNPAPFPVETIGSCLRQGTTSSSAQWTVNTYSVKFDANGGSGTMGNMSFTYDSSQTLTANAFTRTGYNFAGWATSAPGSTVYSDRQSVNNLTSTNGATVTLYAKWTPKNYLITFVNPLNDEENRSIDCKYKDPLPPYTNLHTRTGYTLEGYYDSASGGTKYYNGNGTVYNNKTQPANNLMLYAHWTANKYTVTLNANGGSGGTSSVTATYDSNMPSATMPTRTGYQFNGYYDTSASSGGTQYYTAGGASARTWNKTSNTTLYARWTANAYSVVFNGNGSTSGSMNNQAFTYDAGVKALTKNAFARVGYIFQGWSTSSSGGINYKDEQAVSNLTTAQGGTYNLYAVWGGTWASSDLEAPKGNGGQTSPYQISNAKQLAWLSNHVATGSESNQSVYAKLTNNIDLSGKDWYPIGNTSRPFTGSFDGQCYSIKGLKTSTVTNASGKYMEAGVGLFGKTSNAVIKNIQIYSSTTYGYENVGTLIGWMSGSTTVTNIYVEGTVNSNYRAGGIVGNMTGGSISACGFNGFLNGTTKGLMIGSSTAGTITDCFAITAVSNEKFYNGSASVSSCLFISNTAKKYHNGTFANWVNVTGMSVPLPEGMSWLATGGTKFTSVEQIKALDYTLA